MLESLNSLSRVELKRLIKDSHALVASKLPKKTREKLGIT
jgi:predicted DNA-binding protein (MmcQ/YjbR family)